MASERFVWVKFGDSVRLQACASSSIYMFVHCSSPPLLRNDYIYNNVSAPSHIRQSVPEHAKGHLFNANVHCNIFLDAVRDVAKKAVEDYARSKHASLQRAMEEIEYEMGVVEAKISRNDGEVTEEQAAAKAALEEKKSLRTKQQEELASGVSKFKGLMSEDVPIDILNEADSSQLNLNSESNAKVFAMEVLEAKKTYVLGKIQKGEEEGSAPEVISLMFTTTPDPVEESEAKEGGGDA